MNSKNRDVIFSIYTVRGNNNIFDFALKNSITDNFQNETGFCRETFALHVIHTHLEIITLINS